MKITDTIKSVLIAAGLNADQISAVEKEMPAQSAAASGVASPATTEAVAAVAGKVVEGAGANLGLSPDTLAALLANQPDPATPENPSTIAPSKPPTVEELQVEILALKARFERLVGENYNKDMGY